ncbi:MAG: aminotransferase class I/II-fold pyridoxal phosphate-dependent enzyme, partial [Myxococcota bacterium]
AEKPIGNFHALPIARGSSIFNSRWIQDMGEFYGANIFLAESSSTSGGLDSLLAPTGPIREAQEAASRAFGSKQTYFVTNGTSTSNKIVCQALLEPGDIVLIDRNCHKSHHYGMVLSDAHPVYLDAYPLESYAIYGAVPLRTIKKQMLDLKKAGRLDRVKMVLLTNCTFDGLVYNPQLVMEELLAIKPDLCFLWDEAWFAYACMSPIIRQRTAMYSARELYERYRSEEYRAEYEAFKTEFDAKDADDPDTWLNTRLMPDPDHVRIRVYATHSTHKSLSALRQGSMLHHWDQDFARKTEDAFHEAFFTHTSTSPNYQVLASLDIARRQVELEGYGMLSGTQHMAFAVRDRINSDPLLSKYFKILTPGELIPEEFRPSGLKAYSAADGDEEELLSATIEAWENDEFVIDPTRMTLLTANSGINGDEFKYDVLMERFGIQVNKTSLNSVLFIATIGVTWGGVSYLLGALRQVAKEIESRLDGASSAELLLHDRRIGVLTQDLPPLPDFSYFHSVFRPNQTSQEGAMRAAYFLNYSEENREYIPLDEAEKLVSEGRELVATTFIIPYPPGFPVLVPGQVVSPEILEFMQKLAIKEVHGYRAELGLPIFKQAALDSLAS